MARYSAAVENAPAEPTISAIIPIRNRGGQRLDNCLRSLRWQALVEGQRLEILISDFGSGSKERSDILQLAQRHGARVVYTETDEVWNRSRALNIGIRSALGRYIFCTDADMLFAPNFVSTLLDVQRQHADGALAVCHCRDMPETIPEQPWSVGDYPGLVAQSPYREKLGTGACQTALRGAFVALRGYDEGYKFWGMEDNDMKFRMIRTGFELVWIQDQTSMLHQWHPSDRGKRPLRKFLNDARFHLSKYVRRKNPLGWGQPTS